MRITIAELKDVLAGAVAEARRRVDEAKKKKEKAAAAKHEARPAAFSYDEALDFSAPLGAHNLYRSQGAVNWGPMTGPGTKIDVQSVSGAPQGSVWATLGESVAPAPRPGWERAAFLLDEKRLKKGFFRKLRRRLAHDPDVRDPARLAGWIKHQAKKS